jgi:small subunit ribosomal protein S21
MLIVNVKDHGSIERALKVLKRKFDAVGTVKELRSRKEFKKPCEKRRAEILDAKYRQSLRKND